LKLDHNHIDILDAYATSQEGLGFNKVKEITKIAGKTLSKKKKDLLDWKLIFLPKKREKRGQKEICRITGKGLKYLTEHNIRDRYGLVGLEWAEEAWKNGYKVRFLSDFTNLEGHDKMLLAWHPRTKDVRLAEIFGIGEFKSTPEGPDYRGQYVDRTVNPDRPIRSNSLRQFVKDNVEDFRDDKKVGSAVKRFYEEHNCFAAVLLPKEIRFGFPKKREGKIQEIGRFNSLMFVGFQGEGGIPFIPRINIMAGGFDLSDNLKVKLNYDMNLMALYTYAWIKIRERLDPNSVSRLQLEDFEKKVWSASFKLNFGIGCKNRDRNGYCKKLKSKCVAFEMHNGEPYLNFKNCDILVNDAKKHVKFNP